MRQTPRKRWSELFFSALKCEQLHVVEYLCTLDNETNLVYGVPKRLWHDLFLYSLRYIQPQILRALYGLGFEEPSGHPDIVEELVQEITENHGNTKLAECLRVILEHKQRSPVENAHFTRHWKMRFKKPVVENEHSEGILIPFPKIK